MLPLGLVSFALWVFLQGPSAPTMEEKLFLPDEKSSLERAQKIDDRIKIYLTASRRMQQSIQTAVSKGDFEGIPDALHNWVALLDYSKKDVAANLPPHKKPKALKQFEIHVRKAITTIKGYKPKAPIEQQDVFDEVLGEAETIRKVLVEIIFR